VLCYTYSTLPVVLLHTYLAFYVWIMNRLTEPVVFSLPEERCKILPILMRYNVLNLGLNMLQIYLPLEYVNIYIYM